MASETILSKWQALFPNNSPESNAFPVDEIMTESIIAVVTGELGFVNAPPITPLIGLETPFPAPREFKTDKSPKSRALPNVIIST